MRRPLKETARGRRRLSLARPRPRCRPGGLQTTGRVLSRRDAAYRGQPPQRVTSISGPLPTAIDVVVEASITGSCLPRLLRMLNRRLVTQARGGWCSAPLACSALPRAASSAVSSVCFDASEQCSFLVAHVVSQQLAESVERRNIDTRAGLQVGDPANGCPHGQRERARRPDHRRRHDARTQAAVAPPRGGSARRPSSRQKSSAARVTVPASVSVARCNRRASSSATWCSRESTASSLDRCTVRSYSREAAPGRASDWCPPTQLLCAGAAVQVPTAAGTYADCWW